jgi:hypothetical protein
MNKTDAKILKRGLKRVGVALLATSIFVSSVVGLIVTATAPGYLAVLLFLLSIVGLLASFVLLYSQGINRRISAESRGESK